MKYVTLVLRMLVATVLAVLVAVPTASYAAQHKQVKVYRIQLASYRSQEAAEKGWLQFFGRNREILAAYAPKIERVDLGSGKGIYYRLYAEPTGGANNARADCGRLKAKGVGCLAARMKSGSMTASRSTARAPAQKPAKPAARTASKPVDAGRKPAKTKPPKTSAEVGRKVVSTAKAASSAKDYGTAIKEYTKAINSGTLGEQDLAEAHNQRGVAYRESGQHDPAIDDFTAAIGIKPDHARAFFNRGLAYVKKGDKARAVSDLKIANFLLPEDREIKSKMQELGLIK